MYAVDGTEQFISTLRAASVRMLQLHRLNPAVQLYGTRTPDLLGTRLPPPQLPFKLCAPPFD